MLADVVRGLPLRRAPVSLESRVFEELARRVALPWWRNNFVHWPLPIRSGFLAACAVLAVLTLFGRPWFAAGVSVVNDSGEMALSWAHPFMTLAASAGGVVSVLIRAIPPFWIYGALIGGALLYAVLFGLGAVVYRTLYFEASEIG